MIPESNRISRYNPCLYRMQPDIYGKWVRIQDYWDLKNEWVKQNILIAELSHLVKEIT